MKLKQWRSGVLAAAASAGVGAGLVSCGTSNTVDYLYATSSKNDPGQINVYRVDSQSGALTQIPDSPYNAGRDPVSLAIDYPGSNLYVANGIDNTIIQFGIGTDAKLYGQHTVNPTGSQPVALAVHSYYDNSGKLLGTLLALVEQFQPNFSMSNAGPGGALLVYNIPANGALGGSPVTQTVNATAASFLPVGVNPTAVNITGDGLHVYVTDTLGANQTGTGTGSCAPGQGGVEGYTVDGAALTGLTALPAGTLTPVAGTPFCAGTTPSAIASVPSGPPNAGTLPATPFLYVTDSSQNQVIGYQVLNTGALKSVVTNPPPTGVAPDGITVDPRGNYVYVANRAGGSVSGYTINQATGALTPLSSAAQTTTGAAQTQAQPGCVIVEPALGRFVYTADFLGNDVSGFILDPNTGTLSATLGVYYGTTGLTRCVAATAHGNHPVINPAH